MNRPLVILTICFIAGILAGEYTHLNATIALALAAFSFLAAAAGHVLGWRENRLLILLLFLSLGLGLSRLWVEESKPPLVDYAGQRVVLVGWVSEEPDVRADKVYYLLQAQELVRGEERISISGTVRLSVKEASQVFAYGDLLKISGLLSRPDPAGNPGAFDYRTYLERQGIMVQLLARGDSAVQKIGLAGASPLHSIALKVKHKLADTATASLTTSQAAVLNGIIFGTQGMIDRETRRTFSETGVVHILSVSGLHVGLVLGGLLGLLRLLRLPPGFIAPLATPLLAFYVLMTGLNPAVLRSAIMALLLIWAHHLGRDRDWPTTLALAALLILLWNPLLIYHPGCQLSFAATWGILYLGPVLTSACSALLKGLPDKMARAVSLALAVPLAAQLATIPLVAWYYNLLSPVSIPANLLAVPLVGLIMGLGLLATALGLIWLPLASLVNVATGLSLDLFLALVGAFQQLPGAVIYLATPPVILMAAWYAGLLAAVRARSAGRIAGLRQGIAGWLPAVVLVVALVLIWWPWSGGRFLTVHFIDVGQGDSVLVQTPGGHSILIDSGGMTGELTTGTGVGDQVVEPYLRRLGVNRIDVLILTHPHEDNCGGAVSLVRHFPVRLAVVSPALETPGGSERDKSSEGGTVSSAYTELLQKMRDDGIPVRCAAAGDNLRLENGIEIEVLAPLETAEGTKPDPNNCSLVLKLSCGGRSFVFTGDAELAEQKELILQAADLKTDVLKIPHHGSRFLLPELVELADPEAAVISVGAHNTFGHPAQSTLELLERTGINVYRTDRDGAVIVQTDGYNLEVRTGKKTGWDVKTINRSDL
ncbi:MAG: DNA internalization-related competence protein ComEC/Rec2 [Peptococcaceae bacterium]|nr:DNA internalization-related competence protein ComEC/Rec2 [Peptococcaceae bacterium]